MEVEKVDTADALQTLIERGQPFLADMPFDLYKAMPAANFSGLKAMLKSPRHYKYEQANNEPTAAMNFGSAFHLAMEGKEQFAQGVACKPKFDMRKTADKQAAAAWDADNAGKISITPDELEALNAICDMCAGKEKLRNLRRDAGSEVSGYYVHPEIGVPCKFRVDLHRPVEGILGDFKTTVDASEEAFKWSARKFAYHMQAAFYLDGMTFVTGTPYRDFLIVAVEKAAPYDLNIFHLDRDDVAIGRELYMPMLAKFKGCQTADVWPGYADEVKKLKLFYHKE